MLIGIPSRRSVLIFAIVAMALVLAGAYLTHQSRVSRLAASDASVSLQESLPVLVVVAGNSPTDAAVGRAVAEAQGGALLAVPVTGLTEVMINGLSQSTPDRVLILGGPAAVTEATTFCIGAVHPGCGHAPVRARPLHHSSEGCYFSVCPSRASGPNHERRPVSRWPASREPSGVRCARPARRP
jgi:hypothetical protein